ncbi:MAG: hypothetical protein MUE41_03405, partial [Gemmatimonadaceae bacterium]|nr:hypothetical protein [Gemmatimonadaceae bacterium]
TRATAGATLLATLVPAVLNHPTVVRTVEPEATLPRAFAFALLDASPPNAVLLLAGDLDGFPVWSLQGVEKRRLDVTPVIVPLLGAAWYADELRRRAHLTIDVSAPDGIRRAVTGARRTLVASPLLTAAQRGAGGWTYTGLLFHASTGPGLAIDRGLVRQQAERISPAWLAPLSASADPAARLAQRALGCADVVGRDLTDGQDVQSLLERGCQLP